MLKESMLHFCDGGISGNHIPAVETNKIPETNKSPYFYSGLQASGKHSTRTHWIDSFFLNAATSKSQKSEKAPKLITSITPGQ